MRNRLRWGNYSYYFSLRALDSINDDIVRCLVWTTVARIFAQNSFVTFIAFSMNLAVFLKPLLNFSCNFILLWCTWLSIPENNSPVFEVSAEIIKLIFASVFLKNFSWPFILFDALRILCNVTQACKTWHFYLEKRIGCPRKSKQNFQSTKNIPESVKYFSASKGDSTAFKVHISRMSEDQNS